LSAPALASQQQQQQQQQQFPPVFTTVPGEDMTRYMQLRSAAAAGSSLSQTISSSTTTSGLGAPSPSYRIYAPIAMHPPLMMVNQPSLDDIQRDVLLRIRVDEALRQQQEVRAVLSSRLLRDASFRSVGSQLFSVNDQQGLSSQAQAQQDLLLQQMALQQQLQELQRQQQNADLSNWLIENGRGMTRPNQKSDQPPKPPE
jgi:hypothetical protein